MSFRWVEHKFLSRNLRATTIMRTEDISRRSDCVRQSRCVEEIEFAPILQRLYNCIDVIVALNMAQR